NIPDDTAADGMEEDDAQTISTWGEPPEFGFEPKDRLTLAGPDGLGLIDIEDAGRVSGARFHYLMGDLVRLEFALMQWGLDTLGARRLAAAIPPVRVRDGG